MKAHIDAIRDALAALGYTTFNTWADNEPAQYLVIGAPAWGRPEDEPVGSGDGSFDVEVRVKAVTGTGGGVMQMLGRVRSVLSPNGTVTTLAVTGRRVEVQYLRSEFVGVDQSVTATDTNRHPALGVDSYRLVSQPTT